MHWVIGDLVYLPGVGVGTVSASEEGEGGQAYTIHFARAGVRAYNADQFADLGFRRVVPAHAVDVILDHLSTALEPAAHWPLPQRVREHNHRVATGDPLQLATSLREAAELSARRPLSEVERGMAEQALTLLAEEIAAVRNGEEALTRAEIERVLSHSGSRDPR
ncbi:MAG: hypothetical protein ABMA64_18880 [Myxococcota bacterium]